MIRCASCTSSHHRSVQLAMAGSEAPRDEALSDLEQARRDWNEASRELKDAHQEQQGLENQIRQAFADGDDTSSLQFHLHYVEKRYQRAEKNYDRAEKRYQEVKEEAQRSTTEGEIRATQLTSPSCFFCHQRHPCVCSASDCRRLLVANSRHWDQEKQLRAPRSG